MVAADADDIREVFEHWVSGWRRVVGGKRPPVLDEKRRGKIRARLREGRTVAECKQAIDGMWATPHNVENKHWDIELVCRDASKFERFLALGTTALPLEFQAPKRTSEPTDPMSDEQRQQALELAARLEDLAAAKVV